MVVLVIIIIVVSKIKSDFIKYNFRLFDESVPFRSCKIVYLALKCVPTKYFNVGLFLFLLLFDRSFLDLHH